MKIVAFSDTHGTHSRLDIPECDVLIFAGDWSGITDKWSTTDFSNWLQKQPATHKIVIPGNHDQFSYMFDDSIHLLENRTVNIEGVTFLGSPYTREFMGWYYMKNDEDLNDMYESFPRSGVDVLITHGPPLGILDKHNHEHLGCPALLKYVEDIKPKIHIFGHIHNVGMMFNGDTEFYNVAILDHSYIKQQEPTVLTI